MNDIIYILDIMGSVLLPMPWTPLPLALGSALGASGSSIPEHAPATIDHAPQSSSTKFGDNFHPADAIATTCSADHDPWTIIVDNNAEDLG